MCLVFEKTFVHRTNSFPNINCRMLDKLAEIRLYTAQELDSCSSYFTSHRSRTQISWLVGCWWCRIWFWYSGWSLDSGRGDGSNGPRLVRLPNLCTRWHDDPNRTKSFQASSWYLASSCCVSNNARCWLQVNDNPIQCPSSPSPKKS